jgi:SAM-dependent methyltransferase
MVDADSDLRTGIWEAFLYQRGHIAALKAALTPLHEWRDGQQRHLGILDIGCGSGTTVFAFDEYLGQHATLTYRGVDHNPPSLGLCANMAQDLVESTGGTFDLARSLEDLPFLLDPLIDTDRVFAVLGYLLAQRSMTDDAVEALADHLATAAEHIGALRIVIADVASSYCKSPLLVRLLRERAHHVDDKLGKVKPYVMRYPALEGDIFRSEREKQTQVHYIIVRP